jgi:hypothetical protein
MSHRHRVKTEKIYAYTGPIYSASKENRKAHGGVCIVAYCACGAKRRTNSTGHHQERGAWEISETEKIGYLG